MQDRASADTGETGVPDTAAAAAATPPPLSATAAALRPTTVVIPAAGFGTRLRPLTDALPKEMLPVGRRLALEHIVEEMRAAGMQRIIFVLSPAKEARVKGHFGFESSGNGGNLTFGYALQPHMRGLGDAVLCAEPLLRDTPDEPFVVALGDAVFEEPTPGGLTRRLVDTWSAQGAAVGLAVQRVPRERISRYGVVQPVEKEALTPTNTASPCLASSPGAAGEGSLRVAEAAASHPAPSDTTPPSPAAPGEGGRGGEGLPLFLLINDIVEKPTPEDAPSEFAAAARYVVSSEVFAFLRDTPPGAGGEIQLTDALRMMLHSHRKGVAVPLQPGETRHDIGGLDSYFRAFAAFALADPDHGTGLREYLRERLQNNNCE